MRSAHFVRRAANETRTRDPDLGKVVLYQLSYCRVAFGKSCYRMSLARHKAHDCLGSSKNNFASSFSSITMNTFRRTEFSFSSVTKNTLEELHVLFRNTTFRLLSCSPFREFFQRALIPRGKADAKVLQIFHICKYSR